MEQVLEQPQQTQSSVQEPDPYSIEESSLSTLAPEARVAFDNVTRSWREKAESIRQKAIEEATSPYKDYEEQKKHADALRALTSDSRFQQWFQSLQQESQQGQFQKMQNQIATPEQWAQAVNQAASGDPSLLQQLQMRQFAVWASPTLKEFSELKEEQKQDRERDGLFSRHPDADELDMQSGDAPSLLEMAVYQVVDKGGGTWEQAYQYARSIADGYKKNAKEAALGMVNSKKNGVTEGTPKTSRETENIIEVASGEEALRRNIEASMKNQNVTYVARNKVFKKGS